MKRNPKPKNLESYSIKMYDKGFGDLDYKVV